MPRLPRLATRCRTRRSLFSSLACIRARTTQPNAQGGDKAHMNAVFPSEELIQIIPLARYFLVAFGVLAESPYPVSPRSLETYSLSRRKVDPRVVYACLDNADAMPARLMMGRHETRPRNHSSYAQRA